jgi:hypothetical protein|tara:strand:+ start:287 stop:697 length:411 start_codon:yes stop_codon:yes gene_type:complete
MNTRKTSIECFSKIKQEGLLSKRRLQVYESIFNYAPCTASEVFNDKNLKTNQSGRFTELRDLGVIYEKGERLCRITGRNVIEWDLTDRLPINFKNKNKTKKQRINDAINSFRMLYKNKDNSTTEDWKIVADLIKII